MTVPADSSLNTVASIDDIGIPQWGELATSAFASAVHAQMPDVKHSFVSIRAGEGAAAFNNMLRSTYGKEALLIPDSPALRTPTLPIWGSGNDLCYRDATRRHKYYTNGKLSQHIREDYRVLEQCAMAGSSVWMGIGNEFLSHAK